MLLHELFDREALAHADRLAIDVPPGPGRSRQSLSYEQLRQWSLALAAEIQPFVAGEVVVAILLPRQCPQLPAAQLAALRCGAAWVCLDHVFPDEHLLHVLGDSGAVMVLTDADGAQRLRRCGFAMDRVRTLPATADRAASTWSAPSWQTERSLAYVIYTSGTTGKPKGVQIEHRGIVSLLQSGIERFGLGPGDRIAQGSSAAYDSSLEETYLALGSGATVVVLDDEIVRSGPDLVPWLRQERITVLCPPPTLLRAMDCADPAAELPDLRLCYAGGEAMPQDLADRWGGALWLENGYGPTECTVTVLRGRLRPGVAVTVGEPVPGNTAFVLDDTLQPVAAGAEGELCIAGIGLARGYLRQPELTAAKFPMHPALGRIYRTGDLVRRQVDGAFVCLGRIDGQVKVRGYRIELEAIESALVDCPGVREAAARTQGDDADRVLVACVVPEDPMAPPTVLALQQRLRVRLPPYAVPVAIGVVAELPRTIGGKLDRRRLPELNVRTVASGAGTPPRNPGEQAIAAAFAAVLPPGANPGIDDDFFALGGDSLRAARLISRLRAGADTAGLAVRDVYAERTIAALAARAARLGASTAASADAVVAAAPGRPWLVTTLQIAWLVGITLVAATVAWAFGFVALPWWFLTLGPFWAVALAPLAGAVLRVGYTALSLWLAVLLKELLIGRYRAGRQPLWGWFHLRHWLVVRAARAVPWSLLEGTVFMTLALRALGARIGRRLHVHRGVDLRSGGWDLLEIGDDVTLAQEAHVGIAELERGELHFGPVRLGARSVLDVRAGVGSGVVVGEDALVTALSYVTPGTTVAAATRMDGVPALPAGPAPAVPAVMVGDRPWSQWTHALAAFTLAVLQAPLSMMPLAVALAALLAIAGIDAVQIVDWLTGRGPWTSPRWVWAMIGVAVIALPVSLLGQALLLRWTAPVPAGVHSRWSAVYLRIWWRTGLVHAAGNWLSGTLFWPAWLRLAGMRIGRGCEVSTIIDVLPEQVTIGAESFLADGVYLGAPRLQAGTVTVAATSLGANTFLGNHVVIPAGERLPDGLLLGVCTTADARLMANGGGWFGQPPLALANREVVTVDRRLTHEPDWLRWGNRVSWEAARMALPAIPLLLAALWLQWTGAVQIAVTGAWHWWALTGVTFAIAALQALFVVALKWLLLGRVRPGQHALWSCWASRWDFLYVVWNRNARALLAQLEGTLLLGQFLRSVGVKVGRRVVLGEGFAQVVDPDMLELQDGATVHALFQAHSFEDRVLKIDRVRIGRNADVGRGTVILYGADIGDGASVLPHSVVMKHEVLPAGRCWGGAPTQQVPAMPPPPAVAPALPERTPGRDLALDFARGLAVIGMVFLHFAPDQSDGSRLGDLVAWLASLLHGKPAALFLLLAGASWSLQVHRRGVHAGRWVWRRALALAAMGLPLWWFVWPTEVLLPMAMLLPIVAFTSRRGVAACIGLAIALLGFTPMIAELAAPWVEIDCLEDGTHVANREFGLATLRYFLIDGSYPLLPWLCLPLLGAALVRVGADLSRLRRWCWLAVPFALLAEVLIGEADGAPGPFDDVAPWLSATWQPTSLAFALLIGSQAIAVVVAAQWWLRERAAPGVVGRIAAIGRLSLTHYLGHLLLVYAPLRLWWPAEDWSAGVGVGAAGGYLLAATLLSPRWLRRWRRGPAETLLATGMRAPVVSSSSA
ncbi:MAG: amino acid adenylation domain-containing protein [Planctomycetes bacterium]|nr:amino acid adenylation domain-containing protein [Planctomycetota bacterium]